MGHLGFHLDAPMHSICRARHISDCTVANGYPQQAIGLTGVEHLLPPLVDLSSTQTPKSGQVPIDRCATSLSNFVASGGALLSHCQTLGKEDFGPLESVQFSLEGKALLNERDSPSINLNSFLTAQ